jgi:hypothetical protein
MTPYYIAIRNNSIFTMMSEENVAADMAIRA